MYNHENIASLYRSNIPDMFWEIVVLRNFEKSSWKNCDMVNFEKIVYPVGNYLLKVNNRSTTKRCEIYSKLTIKTPERCQWYRSGVFIVNFEHISHLVLVSIVNFEHVNADWVGLVDQNFLLFSILFQNNKSLLNRLTTTSSN